MLAGEETYEIGSRKRSLRKGEFMMLEAGHEVVVRTSRNEETVGLCVYLGARAAINTHGDLLREAVVFGGVSSPLGNLMQGCAVHLATQPEMGLELAPDVVAKVSSGAEEFLISLNEKVEMLGYVKRSTRIETMRRAERARSFIHENAGSPIDLEEIANHAALSQFHLTRSFGAAFGTSPLAYHRALRLDAAAERLKRREETATEIAEDLGYASLSAFTRAFRQRFGVPPSRVGELP
ncbi:MAG TPA: AraC family transcriptional regulator [Sphingomonadaceae bacterium]|nr:AraC family transcriptional regulator [Sphingomonadaceae bacterium]